MILALILRTSRPAVMWVLLALWLVVSWIGRRALGLIRSAHHWRGLLVLIFWLVLAMIAIDVVVGVARALLGIAWNAVVGLTSNVPVDVGAVLLIASALFIAEMLLRLSRQSDRDDEADP